MAKRKPTNSTKSPSAASPSRKPAARSSNKGPAPTAKKSTPAAPPAFSPHEIGNVAGHIWSLLSTNGDQTLAALKKSVDAPADLVLAAIGWLAREDKLQFATTGRTVKISLR